MLFTAAFAFFPALVESAIGQTAPYPSNSVNFNSLKVPSGAPAWFAPQWHHLLQSPQPNTIYKTPGIPAVLPLTELDADPTGYNGFYQPLGPITTSQNAFFQSLGTNGRSCATCHDPSNRIGLSLSNIRARFNASWGTDPLFAPVDGATCPNNVPASLTYGSMIGPNWGQGSVMPATIPATGSVPTSNPWAAILNRGLIRIPLPVPANAQFTVQVIYDPYGCNTNSAYDQVTNPNGSVSQVLSVYRRVPISAQLIHKTQTLANNAGFPPIDPVTGTPLAVDSSGNFENGNIMWDGREPTLSSQAIDATLGHAQSFTAPTAAQVAQMVAFETNMYTGQNIDNLAGVLSDSPVTGGPVAVDFQAIPTAFAPIGGPVTTMSLYGGWANSPIAQQASVARGENIFNNVNFTISNIAGLNNVSLIGNPVQGSCAFCHSQNNIGTDSAPVAQHDLGVADDLWFQNGPTPALDLPVFYLSCTGGNTTPYNTSTVLTNDPGKALITGLCSDIGRFTVPDLRALAVRAPYFHDGSAQTLTDVVNFYNKKFSIGYTSQQINDLVNLLKTL